MRHDSTFYRILLLLLAALCGCSRPARLPAEVAQHLAQADHIVVATNGHLSSPLTITGEEVGKVARAVASAKHDRNNYDGIWNWDVQFYQGTNFVTVIHLMDRTFWTEDAQFRDDSGVLKAFYRRMLEDADKLERGAARK
jgi:hypothetical protein